MSFEMNPSGRYVKIILSNDGYDFLKGYEFASTEEGTGIFFTREQLEKYANPEYYDDDDKPNESSLSTIQQVLEKYLDVDLFIFY